LQYRDVITTKELVVKREIYFHDFNKMSSLYICKLHK
jgi:hypothetical protein